MSTKVYYYVNYKVAGGVARAFPGGRAAHPENQIEGEKEGKLRKNGRK